MPKYAAVLPLLVALVLLCPELNQAENNIGCLFSDTLCDQDREWCFDDQAFGHCLSDYGHYTTEDLYRYELGSEELRVLEQEMQRLFLLGYRWSHTYTQCLLQTLLRSFRDGSDFDVSSCNGDLDQDLEGALKAIEGEELVDPRDLAIVRFTPSVTDPHSDYADEVYFPPIREELMGSHLDSSNNFNHQDSNSKGHEESDQGGLQDTTPTDQSNSIHNSVSKLFGVHPHNLVDGHDVPHDDNNMANNHIHNYMDNDEEKTNEIYSQHYQPYSKRGYMSAQRQDLDLSNYTPHLSSKDIFLTYDRDGDSSSNRYRDDDRQSYDDQYNMKDDDDDMRGGEVFREEPTRPMYSEGGMQFVPQVESNRGVMEDDDDDGSWSNLPEVFPAASSYGGYRSTPQDMQTYPNRMRSTQDYNQQRNILADTQQVYNSMANLPLNMPGYGRNIDDYQHYQDLQGDLYGDLRSAGPRGNLRLQPSPYNPYNPRSTYNMALPRNMVRVPEIWEQQSLRAPVYRGGAPFGYRRYGLRDTYPYQSQLRDAVLSRSMMEGYPPQTSSSQQQADIMPYNLEGYDEEDQDYGDYSILSDYSDYDTYDEDHFGRQRGFPFMQKFVKKDEETIGADYGDLAALRPWSFQREERQDVKKPGPFFNSKNNYAFRTYNTRGLRKLFYQLRQQEIPQYKYWDYESLNYPITLWPANSHRNFNPLWSHSRPFPHIPQPTTKDVPDLLLEEEKLVEAAEDVNAQSTIEPQTAEEGGVKEVKEGEEGEGSGSVEDAEGTVTEEGNEGKEEEKEEEEGKGEEGEEGPSPPSPPQAHRAPPPPGLFITVITKNNLASEEDGRKLAKIIMEKAGLQEKDIQNLSVVDNQVTFKIPENELGITANHVAVRAEHSKEELKQEGFDVQSPIMVHKSTVSAVMFNPDEKHMIAAAVIVCGVMGGLVVTGSVLFLVRRHARAKAKLPPYSSQDTEAKDYEDLCRARMVNKGAVTGEGGKETTTAAPSSGHAPSGQRVSSLSRDSDNGNNSPSSRSSTSSWSEEPVTSNMDISTGHMVLSYMEDHLKNKDRLEQEWIALCAYEADSNATTLALKPENNQKNRYPDAVPYDNNRVVLNAHANVNGSDYINASPITDHDPRNPTYIATQGPLEGTAADFWQLVWEQGSVVVVMLSRLTENGQSLCFRYWPEEGSELYHIYEVHLVSEHIWCDDYLVRSFYLKNVRTGETRTVTQFHFLSWPDSGTPASTKALLEFRRKVNKSYRGRSCPIIVHCSDGIGRTGTYSLIDMVLNRMAKGAKEIDIAATLEHIRDQRPHMVRTKAQFEFVLMAVAEEVHAILKALPQ